MSRSVEVVFGVYAVAASPVLKARAWRELLIRSARELSESLLCTSNGHDEHFGLPLLISASPTRSGR